MARKKLLPPPPDEEEIVLPEPVTDTRTKALARVAGKMKHWRPARQVLTKVQSVPTIFPWLDYATRVRGFPTQRIAFVHGPSAEGKTELALGLGCSFLQRGHFFMHIDSEMTTPITWLEGLLQGYADSPAFLALRPRSYEHAVDATTEFLRAIIEAKKPGKDAKGKPTPPAVPADTSGLIVVDSLRKLVPENFQDKIRRYGAQGDRGSVDGDERHGAAVKAKMNADWFDTLTPLLYEAGVAMLIIARESENRDKAKDGVDWKLTGGRAVLFEGSLMMRVERDWERLGTGKEAVTIGERHDVALYKSKVAGKGDEVEWFSFWTSNGKVNPEGFDQGRDLVELGIALDVVKQAGGWFTFGGTRWQGKERAVKRVNEDLPFRAKLDAAVRAKFDTTAVDRSTAYNQKTGELA